MSDYIVDKEFKDNDFLITPLAKGDYENCEFTNCSFDRVDLSWFSFCECRFKGCFFNACSINNTSWREVTFAESKLTGLHFEESNNPLVDITITDSTLELCSFNDMKITRLHISNSKLLECDFSSTHMEAALLNTCNFDKSIFENTHLAKANLKGSYNFYIDPEHNSIKQAVFSLQAVQGLLHKYQIILES